MPKTTTIRWISPAPYTRVHYHAGARYAYSRKLDRWLRWHNSDIAACLSGWMPIATKPAHIKD